MKSQGTKLRCMSPNLRICLLGSCHHAQQRQLSVSIPGTSTYFSSSRMNPLDLATTFTAAEFRAVSDHYSGRCKSTTSRFVPARQVQQLIHIVSDRTASSLKHRFYSPGVPAMDSSSQQGNLRRDLLLAAVRGIQSGFSSDESAAGTIKSAELLSEAISVSVKTQVKDVLERFAHQQGMQAANRLTRLAEQLLCQQSNTLGRASLPIHRDTISQSDPSPAPTYLSGSLIPPSLTAKSHNTSSTFGQLQYATSSIDHPSNARYSSKPTEDDGLLFGQIRSNESGFAFGQRSPMPAAAFDVLIPVCIVTLYNTV